MFISVLIATYNGLNKVKNCISALNSQSFAGFEIIVLVDGSTDGTADILRKLPEYNQVKVIEQANGGRAVARNQAASYAQGDLFIFLDDDTRPIPTCIQKHVTHHLQHPHSVLVGNPIEDLQKMKTDFQRFKQRLSAQWAGDLASQEPPLSYPFLTAANFSISREVFDLVGGFDNRLKDAEDYELAIRLFQKQVPIYFDKDCIAWHDDFLTCKRYVQRLREYSKAHQRLEALRPEIFEHFPSRQIISPKGWKKLIYEMASLPIWVWCIDHFNFFRFLPSQWRYKCYAAVVTGLSSFYPHRSVGR